jgi:hypothetical protein
MVYSPMPECTCGLQLRFMIPDDPDFRCLTEEELRGELERVRSEHAHGEVTAWVQSRPEAIRELAARYPWDRYYRVREGAPYGLTVPGSIVAIVSYWEDGSVSVVLLQCPRKLEQILRLHGLNPRIQMDPEWLEPYELPPAPETNGPQTDRAKAEPQR